MLPNDDFLYLILRFRPMMLCKPFSLFFTALLAAATILAACDSAIDVSPSDQVPRDVAFSSVRNAEAVLLGAYSALQLTGAYGGTAYMAADFTTSNAAFTGSFQTFQALQSYQVISTNGSIEEVYDDPYDGINRANEIIANVESVPEIDPDLAAQFIAEARFIRALEYHHLVRYFAQPYDPNGNNDQPGVPLKLQPTIDPNDVEALPRASVADVYSQINADLTAAIETFARVGGSTVDGRADLGAARALLARVRLYQSRHQSAADLATQVIESGDYELVADLTQAFGTSNSSEDVFAVQNTANDNSGTNDFPSSFYLPSALGGRGDITVTPNLLAIYDDALDARQQALTYRVGPNSSRIFGVSDETCAEVNCWTFKYRSPTFEDNIRVIRLAEVYLIRAEAQARLGNDAQALADLNTIRTRAGLPAYASVDDIDGSLLDEIILERRRELAFEGKRRHTILRLDLPLVSGGVTAPETQRILPIPAAFLDANDALTQNPGY